MGNGAEATRANWQALLRLAALLFRCTRRENPDWDSEDLERHLSLPRTNLFRKLAEEAGFGPRRPLVADAENKILKAMLRGVFGARGIARETNLPLSRVEEFLEQVGVPFAAGGYGMFRWPGKPNKAEDGALPTVQPRRVSQKGQFSYKGHTYGLGSLCAGRVCWVEEAGESLVVHLPGHSSVKLRKRASG